jgi:hypothetical protein
MVDERARQILFQTYSSPAGWKENASIAPADFDYARRAGFMFDAVHLSHDDIVAKLGRHS